MQIPFVDLAAQYAAIGDELRAAVLRVMESQEYVQGPEVAAFEAEFATACGVAHSVATNSGTSALHLALLAVGVGSGDEVITVAHTFIATAEAIASCNALPVFVDIDPATHLLDPALLEAAITPRTRAIVPVHLYGQVADMDAICAIASRHGIPVVEDACQAHGALYQGRRAGSLGRIGCFSFYPSKNLGTIGEGGAAVTNDPELAAVMRRLRDHGQSERYYHQQMAFNYRMGALQAAALRVKLPHLDRWNGARRAHAAYYRHLLAHLPLTLPVEADYGKSVYHLFVIRTADRDGLRRYLAAREVATGIHYPLPVHRQEAFTRLGLPPVSLPVTEQVAAEVVSLPMYAELRPEQIDSVARALTDWYAEASIKAGTLQAGT